MSFSFDPSKYKPHTNEYPTVPTGTYNLKILSVEEYERRSDKRKGLKVKHQVVNGEHAGTTLTKYLPWDESDQEALSKSAAQFTALLNALNIGKLSNLAVLNNKVIKTTVALIVGKDDGKKSNFINYNTDMEGVGASAQPVKKASEAKKVEEDDSWIDSAADDIDL